MPRMAAESDSVNAAYGLATWFIITASVAGIPPSHSNLKFELPRAGYSRCTADGRPSMARSASGGRAGATTETRSTVMAAARQGYRVEPPPLPAGRRPYDQGKAGAKTGIGSVMTFSGSD